MSNTASRAVVCVCLSLTALGALAGPVWAQDDDACFDCHDDRTLKGERDGKPLSVFVSPKTLAGSVHARLACVDCHTDLKAFEGEHEPELARVNCATCHERVVRQQLESLHGQAAARGDPLAPTCLGCHGKHDILSKTDPGSPTSVMKVPFLCGRCHHEGTEVSETRNIPEDRILENYSESIHGEGLLKRGLAVAAVCTSCHTAHHQLPHTDVRSSIHPKTVARTCTQCHRLIEQVHTQVIEGRLWEQEPGRIPACVDCHSPHKIRRVFYNQGTAPQDCLRCHGEPTLSTPRGSEAVSLYVDSAAFAASSHGKVACAQCHTEVSSSHERACETVQSPVDCSICHADQVRQHDEGIHGQLAARGDPDAPRCLDCHAYHTTQSQKAPSSPTYPRNVPELCARCHQRGEKAARRIHGDSLAIVQSYEMSIHGKGLLESGLVVTATCSDCHTAHSPLPPSDPKSSVHPDRVADTCGKCHHGIEDIFKTSIHWPGNVETDRRLPTCEDCHTSHDISRTDRADFRLLMMSQCGRCHSPEAETFFDTYHGKVSQLGSAGAAKCYDCHGTHDIRAIEDPRSTLSRDHVVETCGQCHEGAHRRFAGYLTHATHHDRDKYPALFWAFWGMTGLLVGTLTFALLHTLAWLIRLFLTRKHWRLHTRHGPETRYVRRFKPFQRGMHLVMLLSFFTLALTGMALKFSYMAWAQGLSQLLGGFDTMGILHRIGAIVLLAVFFLHLRDQYRDKRACGLSWWALIRQPDSIIFNRNDLAELVASIRWFFGRGERPRYGRYTYWEKFDYFAVLWGVAIIGSTGLVLWFPELFTYILPGWSVNVATIVHSDEALLAVAFIFTVHFFNTHFRPDKFPMDPVIFTGLVAEEELRFDKPREYEALVERGELAARLGTPLSAPAQRWIRVFGFAALAVGLSLVGLILYTMIVSYR